MTKKGDDYHTWREDFILLVKIKRLISFIDQDPNFDKDNLTNHHETELVYEQQNNFFWLVF